MKLLPNKRGMEVLLFLGELLVVAFAMVILIGFAVRAAKINVAQEAFFAKDSAVLLDALHAVPGDVIISYQTGNFSRQIDAKALQGTMTVKGSGANYELPYHEDKGITIAENEITIPEKTHVSILFSKANTLLSFTTLSQQNQVQP